MIDAQLGSIGTDVRGSDPVAGDESGIPLTQILQGAESVCGSNAVDSAVSDGAIYSGSKAVAVIGTVS